MYNPNNSKDLPIILNIPKKIAREAIIAHLEKTILVGAEKLKQIEELISLNNEEGKILHKNVYPKDASQAEKDEFTRKVTRLTYISSDLFGLLREMQTFILKLKTQHYGFSLATEAIQDVDDRVLDLCYNVENFNVNL